MKKYVLIAILALLTLSVKLAGQQLVNTTPVTGLSYPVAFTFTPDGRYLVTLKEGTIKIFNTNGTAIGDFYDLTDSTFNDFERGLLGIEVDPDFATNHYVYAYYNHRFPNNNTGNTNQRLRVVRFTEVNNVGTNPTVILDLRPGYSIAGNHVGGNLRIRPTDGKMYVTIGELAVPANAQLLTNPYGKFLRINTDGTIPTDNPFYDDGDPATGNDDRIWSYGHRNAFDFTFSDINDSLYSSENGQNTWDEANIVTRGGNYGWNTCEGEYTNGSTSNLCNNPNYINPIETWAAPLPAVTGILHYNSCQIPALFGHILVSDNDNGRIYNLEMANGPAYDAVVGRTQLLDIDALTTLKIGPDGALYALNGGYAPNGKIYKIAPQTPDPAPDPTAIIILGIVPYEGCVNQPFQMLAGAGTGNALYEFTLMGPTTSKTVKSITEIANLTPTETGVHDLMLTTTNGCTTATTQVSGYLTVYPEPVFTLNTTNAVQGGALGSAFVNGLSNVNSITWLDANNQPIAQNDSIQNLAPGNYSVVVTNGGVNSACITTQSFVIDLTNGVSELAALGVKLYPNPASSKLFVDFTGKNLNALNAQVYNSTGALVLSQSLKGNALAELDVARLPTGIYYLHIAAGNKLFATTWMKE